MVVHQHIGMHRDGKFLRVFLQQRKQHLEVSDRCENRLPVIAALDDVVGVTGNGKTGKAGHELHHQKFAP